MSELAAAERRDLRNYLCVAAAYWADTLTDGAVRVLVLFYFYQLGYSPLAVASLFLLYEVFGIITNLCGGYLGARFGLKTTLFLGLGTQLVALGLLALAPVSWLVVPYVMASQALSGIAKDLTKMSSKSAVKLVAGASQSQLYKWVAILTGSKNAMKGAGFFLGGWLLSVVGFQRSLLILGGLVMLGLVSAAAFMRGGLGAADKKAKFRQVFSRNRAVNVVAAARLFLFGARDVWFVVGLPIFLATVLGWPFWQAGGFMALWIIGYGAIQASTPAFLRRRVPGPDGEPSGRTATWLAFVLAIPPGAMAIALSRGFPSEPVVIVGLLLFGIIFALNSAVHSFLILAYTDRDKVAMNVGFYYMANACGRLLGTVLSGLLYQIGVRSGTTGGLTWCLVASTTFVLISAFLSLGLPSRAEAAKR